MSSATQKQRAAHSANIIQHLYATRKGIIDIIFNFGFETKRTEKLLYKLAIEGAK